MNLQEYRAEIDRVDRELTRLFAERMDLAAQIAAYKKENGLPILDEKREREKLDEITEMLPEELKEAGAALYERIFALSRAYQRQASADEPAGHRENIILIGMPGCGKTTLARRLAAELGCEAFDSDELISEKAGLPVPEIFALWGEECFRELETRALEALCARKRCVVSTGGGCVTRPGNYTILRNGGTVVWVKRELDKLPTDGRPISRERDLSALYAERAPLYERFADAAIENDGSVEDAVRKLLQALNVKTHE